MEIVDSVAISILISILVALRYRSIATHSQSRTNLLSCWFVYFSGFLFWLRFYFSCTSQTASAVALSPLFSFYVSVRRPTFRDTMSEQPGNSPESQGAGYNSQGDKLKKIKRATPDAALYLDSPGFRFSRRFSREKYEIEP